MEEVGANGDAGEREDEDEEESEEEDSEEEETEDEQPEQTSAEVDESSKRLEALEVSGSSEK
jgi:hypothetical protein